MARMRTLGEAIHRDHGRLDVLVNNTGIWLSGDNTRRTSPDGHELSSAVNYVSHFLLPRVLLPIIPPSPASRTDPATFATAQSFITVMSTLASYLPARQENRRDPVRALAYEYPARRANDVSGPANPGSGLP